MVVGHNASLSEYEAAFFSGDDDALAPLHAAYNAKVTRIAARVVGIEEAEDVSQEVWLKVFVNRTQFRNDAKFTTWLYRIAFNTAVMHVRKQPEKDDLSVDTYVENSMGEIEGLSIPAKNRSPLEGLLDAECEGVYAGAVNSLPDLYRSVIDLRDCGCSYKECANTLNIPLGTVKVRLNRGRELLSEKMQQHPLGQTYAAGWS